MSDKGRQTAWKRKAAEKQAIAIRYALLQISFPAKINQETLLPFNSEERRHSSSLSHVCICNELWSCTG